MLTAANPPRALPALAAWQRTWLLLAALSLLPVGYFAYQDTHEAGRLMRVQLIERCSLWETAPEYAGTPQAWTRFAAWLLDTEQLMERVSLKYGPLAEQIEVDFRRDRMLVFGRIIAGYFLLWLAPLVLLYGAGFFLQRRRRS